MKGSVHMLNFVIHFSVQYFNINLNSKTALTALIDLCLHFHFIAWFSAPATQQTTGGLEKHGNEIDTQIWLINAAATKTTRAEAGKLLI